MNTSTEEFVPPILPKGHPVFRKKRKTLSGQELATSFIDGTHGWAVFAGRKFEYQWFSRFNSWKRVRLPVSIFESPIRPVPPVYVERPAYFGWGE